MHLEKGRPENSEGRSKREKRVYDFLDQLQLNYARVDHEAAETMETCKAIDEVLEATICKNLFLCNRQKTNYYLLMMPGDKAFKTKELSAQIASARLSFASPEDMLALIDSYPGAVSVMGIMNDKDKKVELLVEEDVLKGEYLGCHPCVNTASLKLKTKDVFEIFVPATGHSYRKVRLTGGSN